MSDIEIFIDIGRLAFLILIVIKIWNVSRNCPRHVQNSIRASAEIE